MLGVNQTGLRELPFSPDIWHNSGFSNVTYSSRELGHTMTDCRRPAPTSAPLGYDRAGCRNSYTL